MSPALKDSTVAPGKSKAFQRRTVPFKPQNIRTFQREARPVYLLKWVNRMGERNTVSLGTRDGTEAKAISLDLERMANTLECWSMQPDDPRLDDFHPKAKQIFFGLAEPPAIKKSVGSIPRAAVFREVLGANLTSGFTSPSVKAHIQVLNPAADSERKGRIEAERKAKRLEDEKKSWDQERLEYRSKLNKHCEVILEDALAEFKKYYEPGHDPHTYRQVVRVNEDFQDLVGCSARVGSIKGIDLNRFLTDYSDEDGNEVSQTTRRKVKAYLSTFWTWAVKEYQLNGNPIDHVHKISGDSGKEIRAIAEWQDFKEYIDAFKDFPFWHAWVAFACLAGPRWWEQAHTTVPQVHLDSGYATIISRKTHKQRNVPLETTLLRPILEKHIAVHDGNSPLLFPSFVKGHGAKGDGIWRSSTWHKYWGGGKNRDGKVVVGIVEQTELKHASNKRFKDAGFWTFGPDEWRHCAGTAMGHSGVSTLRISQWLCNTEKVCRDHYIAPMGRAIWPLKWTHEILP